MPKAREEGAREGVVPPLVRGGLGASPEDIFEFRVLLCAFLMFFYAFGTRF